MSKIKPVEIQGLSALREKITRTDEKLIAILAERKDLVAEIAHLKAFHNLPIVDEKREKELTMRLLKLGRCHGLRSEFVLTISQIIIAEAVRTQATIKALVRQVS